jgi:hypothetical protein
MITPLHYVPESDLGTEINSFEYFSGFPQGTPEDY